MFTCYLVWAVHRAHLGLGCDEGKVANVPTEHCVMRAKWRMYSLAHLLCDEGKVGNVQNWLRGMTASPPDFGPVGGDDKITRGDGKIRRGDDVAPYASECGDFSPPTHSTLRRAHPPLPTARR